MDKKKRVRPDVDHAALESGRRRELAAPQLGDLRVVQEMLRRRERFTAMGYEALLQLHARAVDGRADAEAAGDEAWVQRVGPRIADMEFVLAVKGQAVWRGVGAGARGGEAEAERRAR
ncbi:hypothetical protein [Streptomyces sp. NPDC051109]|uniref:hypothetical protein n=1 Tax=Streptomyces sp. NPDC051109 TaxID=3365642 RepID=UPI0037BA8107